MKTIFIIRHAKSDYGPQYPTDFDRSLNARGRRDAGMMAVELKKVTPRLDQVLVSSARRTQETAHFFLTEFQVNDDRVTYDRNLYLPAEKDIWDALQRVNDEASNVALISHNPAVESILHRYHPGEKLPTCSILELHFDGLSWKDVNPDKVRFISHKYPSMYAK